MTFSEALIQTLTTSIKNQGNKPLTTLHLLNIVKLCDKMVENESVKQDELIDEILNNL